MSNFEIIIQETTAGLNTMFRSHHSLLGDEDLSKILEDERIDSVQVQKKSIFYSVRVTKNCRVYSLIDPKITDNFDRSGYRVTHLISTNKLIGDQNFVKTLELIADKFNEYKSNGMLGEQDYSGILQSIKEVKYSSFVCFQGYKKYYTTFHKAGVSSLNETLNSKNIFLAEKIYAFEEEVFNESIAKSLGLQKLEGELFKEYKVSYDAGYLKRIIVDNKEINQFPGNELVFLTDQSATPIAEFGKDNKRQNIIKEVSYFRRPSEPKPKIDGRPQISKNLGAIIIAGFLVLFIVAGLLFSFDIFPFNKSNDDNYYEHNQEISKKGSINIEESKFTAVEFDSIKIDTLKSPKGNVYYKTSTIPDLENLLFYPEKDNEITYYLNKDDLNNNKNRKEMKSAKDVLALSWFKKDSLSKEKDSVNLINWGKFAKKLEKISGKKIPTASWEDYIKEIENKTEEPKKTDNEKDNPMNDRTTSGEQNTSSLSPIRNNSEDKSKGNEKSEKNKGKENDENHPPKIDSKPTSKNGNLKDEVIESVSDKL